MSSYEKEELVAFWQKGNVDANSTTLRPPVRRELYIAGELAHKALLVGVFAMRHIEVVTTQIAPSAILSDEQVEQLNRLGVVAVPAVNADASTVSDMRRNLETCAPAIERDLADLATNPGTLTVEQLTANIGRLHVPRFDADVPSGLIQLLSEQAAKIS